jgi:CubicO group peptidase (beta-lactamase class C family)
MAARSSPPAFPAIDKAIAEEMAQQNLPGLAFGIAIDGELAYAKGYGVTDLDAKTVPDPDTVYRIGSITKSFTALAILSLRDDGVLGLDDPLVKWIPEASGIVYPSRDSRPITLRQLLDHTSGLPRDFVPSSDEAAFVESLDGIALQFAPGTSWSYSNLGSRGCWAVRSVPRSRRSSPATRSSTARAARSS